MFLLIFNSFVLHVFLQVCLTLWTKVALLSLCSLALCSLSLCCFVFSLYISIIIFALKLFWLDKIVYRICFQKTALFFFWVLHTGERKKSIFTFPIYLHGIWESNSNSTVFYSCTTRIQLCFLNDF